MTHISTESRFAIDSATRSIADVLAPLDKLATTSPSVVRQTGNSFEIDGAV